VSTCDECGYDEDDNDGPLTDCPECDRSLCDRCYGDPSFEWCADCRKAEAGNTDGGGR